MMVDHIKGVPRSYVPGIYVSISPSTDGSHLHVPMLLATAGSDVLSQLERFKESFLWAAAKGGRVEECESLVQMGTDVNWVSPEGDTPLLAACRNGHFPAALCLLDNGAEVDLAAGDGQTALHFCCCHGNEAIAEALIMRGASVLARDNRGATAFESPGPHVPAGMLRRLNIIAQRRQDHGDNAGSVSIPGAASASTPEASITDTRPFRHLNARPGNDAVSGNARSGSEDSRSGRRSGGHQERPIDAASESVWSLRSAALHGGRGGSPRGEGRTTFPSIAPSVATLHRTSQSGPPRPEEIPTPRYTTRSPSERGVCRGVDLSVTSRNLEMHRHASREVEALRKAGGAGMQHLAAISHGESSSEGFQSSDDDEDDNELFEVGTGFRLLGGVCLGSNARQRNLPGRNHRGRHSFPESMRLMSAGDPVPHAPAAIAAAIASSAAPAPVAVNPTYSTTSDTLVSPSRQPLDTSPRGGTGSNGSAGGRGSRDNGGGGGGGGDGDGSLGGSSTGAAVSHNMQTASISTPALIYGSTSTTSVVAAAADGGAGSTRVAERNMRGGGGGGELVGQFGPGDAPVARVGSHDSAEDRGEIRCRGFNALGEGSGTNDHVELIRMLWLQEKESRLAAEAKAEAVRDQSARLWNELVRSEKQVLSLEEAVSNARKERDTLKATLRGQGLKGRSLQELEQLEKDFRKALEGVCGERDRIVQGQLAKEEQRLCVVCQENERGVLLLPCRHLCVCRSCSERQELTLCPLCRDSIAESLVVYS